MPQLERLSLAIEEDLLRRFDYALELEGGTNRSEAIRDLIRAHLVQQECAKDNAQCTGTVTLIYDHAQRQLAAKMLEIGHHHSDAMLATLHVHLDEEHCLEVVALKGKAREVRRIFGALKNMRGVKHAQLVISSEGVLS